MDSATLIYQADAIAHYSEWEDRLRDRAKMLDALGVKSAAEEARWFALLVHRAVTNEERNDHSGELS